MKFRIWTILWVFALLASAMATFGGWSILLSTLIVGVWLTYFANNYEPFFLLFIPLTLFAVGLFPEHFSAESARCNSCANNMRQLALAAMTYEDALNVFPAHAQRYRDSKEQSWRLWIFPFLESSDFYTTFRKSEPWDSPYNRKFVSGVWPDWCFHCPSCPSEAIQSHYLAIVGEHTMWPPDRGRKINEVTDGTGNTILLIEAPQKKIPWAKPEDMSFEEAVELLSNPPTDNFGHAISAGFFYKPTRGINVAFADASSELIELPIAKELAEALLTVDDGEQIDRDDLVSYRQPKLDYARIYSLSVFVLLSALPAANLKKKPSKSIEIAA